MADFIKELHLYKSMNNTYGMEVIKNKTLLKLLDILEYASLTTIWIGIIGFIVAMIIIYS